MRMLFRDMERAGFANRGGKGSHRNYEHPDYNGRVTLSGKPGDDASRYKEKLVRDAIEKVKK